MAPSFRKTFETLINDKENFFSRDYNSDKNPLEFWISNFEISSDDQIWLVSEFCHNLDLMKEEAYKILKKLYKFGGQNRSLLRQNMSCMNEKEEIVKEFLSLLHFSNNYTIMLSKYDTDGSSYPAGVDPYVKCIEYYNSKPVLDTILRNTLINLDEIEKLYRKISKASQPSRTMM